MILELMFVVVIDGDTLKYGNERIRLHGIDAPELSQVCYFATGKHDGDRRKGLWKRDLCGKHAKEDLEKLVVGGVTCEVSGKEKWGRYLAVCVNQDGIDVGQKVVQDGWALAYQHYSLQYVPDEDIAVDHEVGLWQPGYQFIDPRDWRKGVR